MDFLKSLKDIANLDEYISVTQNVNIENKNVKVPINITTVLTLKGMRSLEIEYLIKCGENGIACIILERLLTLPATKAWGSASGLGKELICLIQYWLEAVRKHLLNHSHLWWKFLKKCLIFIKNIRSKSCDIPDLLVEHLTECLLDIATSELPDVLQKYEILYVLNLSCAESTKELRFALRNMFNDYFVKLAAQMATSGYLPHQYSVLECLIRWLVPRDKLYLREASAEKWFPPDLYPTNAVTIFKHSSWANFFKDARDFLNALNIGNGLVTSVLLRRLFIGNSVIISGSEKRESWLDLNTSTRCATVLLDSTALGLRDAAPIEHSLLYVDDDNTITVTLHSESGIKLSITVDNPSSLIRPTDVKYDQTTVSISLSSRNDIPKTDQALKRVFGDKYQMLLDLNSLVSLSPPRSIPKGKTSNMSDDDVRLSHPAVEVRSKRHCGVISKAIRRGLNTPSSSASTSSFAKLYKKLKALPRPQFDKERVSICAQPALSCVSERTEVSAAATTLQYQTRIGVWNKKIKSQSDNEVTQSFNATIKSQSDTEATIFKKIKRPVVSHNDISLLLAQSVDSNDESVINATIERLSQKKGFDRRNIVDLLVEEQRRERDKGTDSGINTDVNEKSQDTEDNSETIEGTPVLVNEQVKKSIKTVCTVVSKSTTDDESNTEVVNETLTFVTSRDQRKNNAKTNSNPNIFDVNVQEDFFSQHYTGNKDGGIVISPSLARKINESSLESSDNLDNCLIMDEHFNPDKEIYEFNDIDIIECLNDVVDKVCQEFDKCSEYLREIMPNDICTDSLIVTPKRMTERTGAGKSKITKTKAQSKPKRVIKIKLKTPEKKKTKNVLANKVKKAKQIIKSPKKMSTITEQTDEEDCFATKRVPEVCKVQTPKITYKAPSEQDTTPLVRRKRKLYSPKDNDIQLGKSTKPPTTDTDEDEHLVVLKVNTTPKTTVSCYKEIETERKKHARSKPKIFKGKVQEPPSPRTLKYDETFDKLKDTVESSEKIVFIDKTNFSEKQIEVYNFNSKSEDDDFKKKKTDICKKISSTTISSVNSKASNRRGRKKAVNYSETIDEAILPTKRKPPAKRKRATKQKATAVERVTDLVDEKMREATDAINTSLIIENSKTKESPNVEFIAKKHPEIESISDTEKLNKMKTFHKKSKKNSEKVCSKKEKHKKVYSKPTSVKEDSRSIASTSPLPCLVVEPITPRKNDADDSITAQMAQKFKKIYQDGPDQNESNITQNMLSDIERNNSQQNIGLSVTDEVRAEYDNLQVVQTKKPTKTKVKKFEVYQKPDPIKEFNDDIIDIPIQSYKSRYILRQAKTKLKDEFKKTNQLKDFPEIIEIPDDKMTYNSAMSIASDRINAHNDSDAAPPSPDIINENFRPREIEDLDQTARDYFEKLTKEMNKSHDNSKETRTSETNNKSEDKSSIMVTRRLSIDDIGKYLPSPKSSTTSSKGTPIVVLQRIDDIGTYHTEKSPKEKRSPQVISKYLASARSSESGSIRSKAKSNDISEKTKSPIVKISRITLEEFDKWLPPMPKLTNPTYRLSPNTKTTPEPDHKPSSPKNKANLRLIFKSNKTKSIKSTNSSEKSSRILRERIHNTNKGNKQPLVHRTALHTRSYIKKLESSNRSTPDKKKKSNIISPVQSFQEFVNSLQSKAYSEEESSTQIQTISKQKASKLTDLVRNDNLESTDHSEDEISKIRRFINSEHSEDEISNVSRFVKPDDSKNKSIKTKSKVTKLTNSEMIARNFSGKRASSPIQVSDRRVKKPRHEEVVISKDVCSQKSQNDDAVTINKSGPSGSSVQDWFEKTEARPKVVAGNVSESSEDAIKYILEKLNTTLDETNRNTNKKFVNLFVETQSQLAQQKDTIHKMNEDAMRDLMEYVENKFVDLNKKSQEMATAFMGSFKEQAFNFIKEDRKQKQALIVLLKEDVHSILGHVEQKLDPAV